MTANRPEMDLELFFKRMPALRGAPPAELSKLASRARIFKYAKADYIFQEGEPADAAWWVAEGIVKIAKLTPDGRMSTMEMLTQDDIFAPAGVMNIQLYPANAVAVTPAAVVKVLKPDVAALARSFPPIIQNVLEQVGRRLQRSHRLRALDSSSSEKKVAAALLWLSEKTGSAVGVSRRELSEIAGVAPETAIRIILEMKKKKWVSATPRSVIASNPAALQSFVEQE